MVAHSKDELGEGERGTEKKTGGALTEKQPVCTDKEKLLKKKDQYPNR